MIMLIEMILGSKVGRVVAEVILVLLLFGCAGLYLEHRGAVKDRERLQRSSDELLGRANKAIQVETARHAADVKANQEKTDAALSTANSLSDALDRRVRDFDAYRKTHPDVARPPGGPGAAGPGECGAVTCGDLAGELLRDGDDLARSVGELDAVLRSCQRDRDSLTGLPQEVR